MTRTRQLLVALALAVSAAGCELIVHIDPADLPGMSTGGSGGAGGGSSSTGGTGGVGGKPTSSSSSGTGGTGGASSSSGTGGGCATAADCPPPAQGTLCASAVCDPTSHSCTVSFTASGDLADGSAQATGDCKKVVCDGAGNPMSADDDTDVPDDGEVCTDDSCSNGSPLHTPNSQPCTENGGKVCGDPAGTKAGHCVACNIDSDCGGGICQLNHCVTSSCNDTVRDGDETDVDCGGTCAPCDDHLKCTVNTDCQSGICAPTLTCTPASCTDGVANEGETDKDCGGPICRPQGKLCGTDQGCAVAGDCESLNCDTVAHTCKAPTCLDGIINQGETDKDCGGPNCGGCQNGRMCQVDTDCASDGCATSTSLCAPQCSDGHRDGVETDVDCGGPNACNRCALTKACAGDSDCASNACDANTNTCIADQCSDHRKDGAETDKDCGGGTCATCALGKQCLMDTDCASSGCQTGSLTCVAQCSDLHQDGAETDKDCGGGTCPKCGTGKGCKVDSDCTSNGCQTGTLICATPCTDLHKDGAETDIDCGGGTCPTCALTKTCAADSDCASSACDGVSLTCVSDQCNDHRVDGAETDMDCGGSGTCSRCAVGKACAQNSDCATNACDATTNTCATSQCNDHHQDGAETDKDCGGGTCPTCVNGKGCAADSDCASNACDATTNKCVADQCSDHRKDGAETDSDCGGGTCAKCALTKKCLLDTDCASNACDGVSFTCVADQCSDHRVDGVETDTDCGGGTCSKCGLALTCAGDTDCASNACDANTNKCVADQCSDHRKDGAETAVDCGGGTCSKCGLGLACAGDSDCASGACDGTSLTCVSDPCTDHRLDGVETDMDCGGPNTCSRCGLGKTCAADSDCMSVACDSVSHTCVSDPCHDDHQDGVETDKDCGGASTCSRCANGLKCSLDSDCVSGACDAKKGTCAASQCSDSKKDGQETDVDCGGGTCPACATGSACSVNSDCGTDACDAVSHKCVASQCSDHQIDGQETDMDCGGPACSACATGDHCAADRDCTSNACDLVTSTCATGPCADQRKDGMETDTDCGGPTCSKCGLGSTCAGDSDCGTDACDAVSLKCVLLQCADNRLDGQETDTDCGGPTCTKCADGLGCMADSDCTSGACDLMTLSCATGPCTDQRQDGAETDVDCGGGTCSKCTDGLGCGADSDCASGACDLVTMTCATSACTDERKDGAETDVDCGGGTCTKCTDGLGCGADSDCTSGACDLVTMTCATSACTDERKDGAETDVDCGGGTCSPCATGLGCAVGTDCTSGFCAATSLVCVADQCSDQRKNGAETDVDCGGGTCLPCANGSACSGNSDCASNNCSSNTCAP